MPPDSERVSLPGCSKNRTFIVGEGPEHEPKQVVIAPGRRFRLEGSKEILDEIKRRDGRMIEVTGLIRKAVITPSGIADCGRPHPDRRQRAALSRSTTRRATPPTTRPSSTCRAGG